MIRILILAGVAAALTTSAFAQETRASAAAKFSKEFKASDTDRNGVLTIREVEARTAHMRVGPQKDAAVTKRLAALWFARADANKDRKVTEAEAQTLLAATFARYDADKDGKVGVSERAVAKKAIQTGR